VSTAALINGARSKLPAVEQAAVTDPASPGGSTRRPACLLGKVAVPWTVAGRRVVDEPARRGPAAFLPPCCMRCADPLVIQRAC
jgi:hypothetical protein